MKSALLALIPSVAVFVAAPACAGDPLPSWNNGACKTAINEFVERVTYDGSPEFVPKDKRIAVFDNDGTLWSEQPLYFQAMFAIDRIRSEAHKHADWHEKQPLKGILEWDLNSALGSLKHPAIELVMLSHAGTTTEQFKVDVVEWLERAKHPRFNQPYRFLVFKPMLELLAYLKENGFTNYIVSGGDVEFMKALVSKVDCFGVRPEHVIGSNIKTNFEVRDGKAVLVRQ
jgi:phosphoglycolate phosphatase-like HAD superfamily hydrolase